MSPPFTAAASPPGAAPVRPGAGATLCLGTGAALPLLHAAWPGALPVELRVLAALPGSVAALLWWRYLVALARPGATRRFPFLAWAATQFYLYWGVGALTTPAADLGQAGPRGWAGAVVAACVVTAAVLVAYPAARALGGCAAPRLEALLPRSAPRLGPGVVLPWLALSAAAQADVLARLVPERALFLAQTLGNDAPLLAALAWRDLRDGGRSPWLWACAVALGLAGLLTGMMEAAIQPVLVAIVLELLLRRRLPWRPLIAGVLLVVAVNPAKQRYREAAWGEGGARQEHAAADPWLAAQRWGRAFEDAWTGSDGDRGAHAAALASRLNELAINAAVLDRTPAAVPHDRGAAWGYLPGSFLPRVLDPDKPNYTRVFNDRFNVVFGFQSLQSTETSTGAFPLVADGYWNLGWPGVVLVALVSGALIGLYAGAFRPSSWAATAVGASLFSQLHVTSAMALQVIGVLQHVAGLAALLWGIRLCTAAVELVLHGRLAAAGGEA